MDEDFVTSKQVLQPLFYTLFVVVKALITLILFSHVENGEKTYRTNQDIVWLSMAIKWLINPFWVEINITFIVYVQMDLQ